MERVARWGAGRMVGPCASFSSFRESALAWARIELARRCVASRWPRPPGCRRGERSVSCPASASMARRSASGFLQAWGGLDAL